MIDVLAHGVGGRTDLPVPVWMAIYGAGMAVLLSFAALGVLWPTPRLRDDRGRPLPRPLAALLDSPVLRWVLRVVVLLATVVLVAAAFLGGADASDNPLPWFLFIVLWVGLVPLSLLFGPVWRVVSPLRTLYYLGAYAAGRDPADEDREPPPAFGYWPATIGVAAFVWVELVMPDRSNPRTLGVLLLLYGVAQLAGAAVYGAGWFARAELFEVYSSLIGRLAPIGRLPDGRLAWRNPLNGLSGLRPEPGLVAFVVVLLGSTAFDGVTRQRWWETFAGGESGWAAVPKGTLGLVACCALVAVTYVAATRAAGRPSEADPAPLPGAFVHSIVPIAIGYAVAHYFTLLLLEGQQALRLASDPFATGANWFGTATRDVDFTILTPRTVALVQIGGVVLGHVLGVIAAHDRAISLFKGRAAVRGQYPLLAVMVAYTLGGVALLLGT